MAIQDLKKQIVRLPEQPGHTKQRFGAYGGSLGTRWNDAYGTKEDYVIICEWEP